MLLSSSKVFARLIIASIMLGSTPTSSALQSATKKSVRAVDFRNFSYPEKDWLRSFHYVSLISIHFTTPSSGWNLRIKSNNSSTPDEATKRLR